MRQSGFVSVTSLAAPVTTRNIRPPRWADATMRHAPLIVGRGPGAASRELDCRWSVIGENWRIVASLAVHTRLISALLAVPLASVDTDQEGLGVAAAERLANILAGNYDDGALRRHPPLGVVSRPSEDAFGAQHPGLRQALELAQQSPNCGVKALATAAGLSPQGLDCVCQKELGMSPGALLRNLRAEAVDRCMEAGGTLAQAAQAAGLSSASVVCAVRRRVAQGGDGP